MAEPERPERPDRPPRNAAPGGRRPSSGAGGSRGGAPRSDRPRTGGAPRAGGSRSGPPPRSGGFRGEGPRSGAPRTGGYRSDAPRTGGAPRPGGSRSGPPPRSGGFRGEGPRSGAPRPDPRQADERTKGWGGVARRGTRNLEEPKPGTAAAAYRNAAAKADRDRGRPAAWAGDQWHDRGPVDERPEPPPTKRRRSPVRALPPEVADELGRGTTKSRAVRDHERLQEAAVAYARERYRDARALLVPLAERAPSASAVRELLGLTYYRMGRWRDAIKELEAFSQLTGSVDQHPVLADAHRALGHHEAVERLWDEMRTTGAGVDTVIEGRIVLAGSRADQNDVPGAIQILEQGPTEVRRPQEHHLRLWYALASLYEKAGDATRARGLFTKLVRADPEFGDALTRLEGLS